VSFYGGIQWMSFHCLHLGIFAAKELAQ
jgi:hypothetical protein